MNNALAHLQQQLKTDLQDIQKFAHKLYSNDEEYILGQLIRSEYQNCYYINTKGKLLGLHIRKGIKDKLDFNNQYSNLEVLKIQSKQLKKIRFESDLPNLHQLDLSNCKLNSFYLGKGFHKLERIILHHNTLTSFHLEGSYSKLWIIDVSHNRKLKEICLHKPHSNLAYFYAYHCNLESFKAEVKLPNLQVLEIKKNENLSELELNHCPRLQRLDLSNLAKLKYLSADIITQKLPALKDLRLKGNELFNIPSEISQQGINVKQPVFDYLKALSQGVIINTTAKIILIGNSEAGKTTIAHQLRNNEFIEIPIEDRTHGIKIDDWEIDTKNDILRQELLDKFKGSQEHAKKKPYYTVLAEPNKITLKVWDFGGQEFYHATHRLFLTNNVIYLLVWEKDTDKQFVRGENEFYPKEYWLESIKYYTDNESNIFEIQNKKTDGITFNHTELRYSISDRNKISVNSYNSCMKALKKAIHANMHKLNYIGCLFPKIYEKVQDALNEKKEPFIDYEIYEQICKSCSDIFGDNHNSQQEKEDVSQQKKDNHQLKTLTNYLHDTGFIICYKFNTKFEEGARLKDIVIIKPTWLISYIYQILSLKVQKKRGEFTESHVKEVTKESKLSPQIWIEILKKFELIFEVSRNGKKSYVAPQYLPKDYQRNYKDLIETAKNYKVLHSFTLYFPKFLPKSLFLRLISNYGRFQDGFKYCKRGLYFIQKNKDILAECNYEQRKISILIQNDDHAVSKNLLEFFLDKVNDSTLISIDEEYFVNLKELKEKIDQPNQEIVEAHKFDKEGVKILEKICRTGEFIPLFFGEQKTKKVPSIIAVFANPKGDLENLNKEHDFIGNKLRQIAKEKVDFSALVSGDLKDIKKLIDYQGDTLKVFHYAGHADSQYLYLLNQKSTLEELANLLVNKAPNLELVFLNGCATEAHVDTLHKAGVKAVIATTCKIVDDTAARFAEEFYQNLANDYSIKNALEEAAKSIGMPKPTNNSIPWGLYIKDGHSLPERSIFSSLR